MICLKGLKKSEMFEEFVGLPIPELAEGSKGEVQLLLTLQTFQTKKHFKLPIRRK